MIFVCCPVVTPFSMLSTQSIAKSEEKAKRKINFGEFAENLTISGMNLVATAPLDRFIINEVELEVTQIGKKCHGSTCAIFNEVGECVMPKEGIFCRVIKGGELTAGITGHYYPARFRTAVVTLSDRAYRGIYEDKSGPQTVRLLREHIGKCGWESECDKYVIPDDSIRLSELIETLAKSHQIIITTGGTGVGVIDITPDVVKPMLDKEIPGIMEMIRIKYGHSNPAALISRSVAGMIGNTLVFTLPGSVKAVDEYMTEIGPMLKHLIYMIHGLDMH